MLILKPDVRIAGLRPEIVLAVLIAERAYAEADCELMLTSGIEGAHSRGSLHYAGSAADLRTQSVPLEKLKPLVERIRIALGPDFDVVLESNHLHIEFQPKEPLSHV
jgi:uncharacterized protein YcbK (DUF882 family)